MWPPCRNFLVKTLKNFCWVSGNEEKLMGFPKIFFVENFVWTCTTIFWRACRNHACKSTKDLFCSKSENDSNAKFSKRSIFSFISLLQKFKKTSSGHAECGCDYSARKFSSKFWKPFARIPEMMKILGASTTKLSLPKKFVKDLQWNFGKRGVTLSTKIRKTSPNSKSVAVTIFSTSFFVVKNDSLAT